MFLLPQFSTTSEVKHSKLSVAKNKLFTSSVVRLFSSNSHIFCNASSLEHIATKCQAVFPLLYEANNLFLSPLLLDFFPSPIFYVILILRHTLLPRAWLYFRKCLWLITTCFNSSSVTISLIHCHIFCNTSSLPSLGASCQTVHPIFLCV